MKKYYYAGATRIAMRTGTANPLWLLGDHLGSTSTVVNYNGLSINSQQLYMPWGEKRPSGASTLPTTYRYTGQRQESSLGPEGGEGLYYYGARFYDPLIGRFTSADTIIPTGIQGFDRYSYANNNPLRYLDPTGHASTPAEYGSEVEECQLFGCLYNITFTGNWKGKYSDLLSVINAVKAVGARFAEYIGGTAASAFNKVFGKMQVESVGYSCAEGCWGRAVDSQHIRFYKESFGKLDPRLVVHELGHSFNARVSNSVGQKNSPYGMLYDTQVNNVSFPKRYSDDNGFAGPPFGWQQSRDETPNEEFADMFLGWTYNMWSRSPAGSDRSNWMNQPDHMSYWILTVSNLSQ